MSWDWVQNALNNQFADPALLPTGHELLAAINCEIDADALEKARQLLQQKGLTEK